MRELFEKAAQILAEGGHCKFTLEDGDGRHCAVGALLLAAGIEVALAGYYSSDFRMRDVWSAVDRANHELQRGLKFEWGSDLVSWNNAPERTGEDVILLFKELAAADD